MINNTFILLSLLLLVVVCSAQRKEDDRDVLHWTPLKEWMGPIACYHSYDGSISTGNHIYYIKAYGDSAQSPANQKLLWGHIVTHNGVTFVNETDTFFNLGNDENLGYDEGSILTSNLLGSVPNFIVYQQVSGGAGSPMIGRSSSDRNVANPPHGNNFFNFGSGGSPVLFSVNGKDVIAYFATEQCHIKFYALSFNGNSVVPDGNPVTYQDFPGKNCNGLNVVQMFGNNFMILRSSGETLYVSSYQIVDLTWNGNALVIKKVLESQTFDHGHDGHHFKFTRSDDKVSGFGWATNKGYPAISLPTPAWKNGMTVMRYIELKQTNNNFHIYHSFNLGTPVRTYNYPAADISLNEYEWSHNFHNSPQLWTLQSGGYVFDLKFNKATISNGGYTIKFYTSGNEQGDSVSLGVKATTEPNLPYNYWFDRTATKKSEGMPSTVNFNGLLQDATVKIILDRTTIEIFFDGGFYAMTEKYYLNDIKKQFNTICITAVKNAARLEASKVEKYQSIWASTGAAASHLSSAVIMIVIMSIATAYSLVM